MLVNLNFQWRLVGVSVYIRRALIEANLHLLKLFPKVHFVFENFQLFYPPVIKIIIFKGE